MQLAKYSGRTPNTDQRELPGKDVKEHMDVDVLPESVPSSGPNECKWFLEKKEEKNKKSHAYLGDWDS